LINLQVTTRFASFLPKGFQVAGNKPGFILLVHLFKEVVCFTFWLSVRCSTVELFSQSLRKLKRDLNPHVLCSDPWATGSVIRMGVEPMTQAYGGHVL